MLKGRKDNTGIYVSIEHGVDFKEELAMLKSLGGVYNFKSKEWQFPLSRERELENRGLSWHKFSYDQVYPSKKVDFSRVSYLREYQRLALKYIIEHNGRAILALPTGLGKTVVAESFVDYTQNNYPCLVVVTASTKYQWAEEIERFSSEKKKIAVLDGVSDVGAKDADFVIVNYDLLSYHIKQVGGTKKNPMYGATSELQSLKSMGFKSLIIDECQRMKADTSLWTKAIQYLGKDTDNVLALSATFMENFIKEGFNVLNLVRPDIFPNFEVFASEFCDPQKKVRWTRINGKPRKLEYIDYSGASNVEELHKLLKYHLMYRVDKQTALPGLPKAIPIPLPLRLDNKLTEAYDDILEGRLDVATKSGKPLSKEKIARQAYMREFCGLAKVKYMMQFLKDFQMDKPDEKLIIFTEHHSVIDYLYKAFEKHSTIYDGRLSAKKKDENKKKFISDTNCQFIFGNIGSLGVGVDGVQKVCNKMVILQLPYNPSLVTQAIGRIERSGSVSDTVTVYFPILKDTIEEDILYMITNKSTNLFTVLDGDGEKSEENIGKKITGMLEEKFK